MFTQVDVSPQLVPLGQWTTISLQVLAIPFDILYHTVFPCQLIVVREVVDHPGLQRREQIKDNKNNNKQITIVHSAPRSQGEEAKL